MPRASTNKKPAVKKAAKKKTTVKKKSTTSKRTKSRAVSSGSSVQRKAPTSVSATETKNRTFTKVLVAFALIFTVMVGGSIALGVSDNGAIDVSNVIEERGSSVEVVNNETGEVETVSIPKNNTVARRPNGGLSGRPVNSAPPPEPVVESATDSATSSDESATSTEAIENEVETINETVTTDEGETNEGEAAEVVPITEAEDTTEVAEPTT